MSAKEEVLSLDDDTVDSKLSLMSRENESFTVDRKVAIMSELVKTMAEGDATETEIPLPNVKGVILKKVIDYMHAHFENPPKEIEKPLRSSNMSEVVSKWDAAFVEVPQETLFELILAANYMDIKPLLDLTCAKVASMIKGTHLFHLSSLRFGSAIPVLQPSLCLMMDNVFECTVRIATSISAPT
jgi:S-phase kinase-associated protein 1